MQPSFDFFLIPLVIQGQQAVEDGAKVPDALLRLGMIEQGQKNLVKAREYFTRVLSSYPKSTAAQSAQKKLAKLDEVKN